MQCVVAVAGTSRRTPPTQKENGIQLSDDKPDKQTVFIQHPAAQLRTEGLAGFEFVDKDDPVNDASIVKDRVSSRSNGYTHPA